MPAADVLRPGGSVGLLACMVIETYSPEHGRRPEVSTSTRYLFYMIELPSAGGHARYTSPETLTQPRVYNNVFKLRGTSFGIDAYSAPIDPPHTYISACYCNVLLGYEQRAVSSSGCPLDALNSIIPTALFSRPLFSSTCLPSCCNCPCLSVYLSRAGLYGVPCGRDQDNFRPYNHWAGRPSGGPAALRPPGHSPFGYSILQRTGGHLRPSCPGRSGRCGSRNPPP